MMHNNIAILVYNSCCRKLLSALSIYTTKILKPNISEDTNTLSQLDFDCENVKYVIKWNYDLLDGLITIPENCILEFDGGSISNGTIIGQDTLVINVGEVNIWGEDLVREGTWREKQGGSSVQSDWNLTDSSKLDYIRNKPDIINPSNYVTRAEYEDLLERVIALENQESKPGHDPEPPVEETFYIVSTTKPTAEIIRNAHISSNKPSGARTMTLPTISKPTLFYLAYPLNWERVENDILVKPLILDSNNWEAGTWYDDEIPIIIVDGISYRILDIEFGKDIYTIEF